MDLNLKDKVVVVTGAAKNIGRGIASGFAREGATVVIADILQEEGEQTAKDLMEQYKTPAHFIQCDISNEEQVKALFQETVSRFGKLDVLVNNAAIYPFKPFFEMTGEDWQKVHAIDMLGVFLCTREAAKLMGPGGKIVSISSTSSIRGEPILCHYSASKGGVNAFTRSVALELADKKINVNVVAPGGVVDMSKELPKERVEFINQFAEKIPWKRMGSPEDMANAVLFLASNKADYITGQVIVVDGGVSIKM